MLRRRINVPGHDLLVHVVEQLSASVLVHDVDSGVEGIDQVPVPVMQVDAQVLSEVSHPVLFL